ncbi:MAG: M28 family peptidase [Flavobacteriales bacterium]
MRTNILFITLLVSVNLVFAQTNEPQKQLRIIYDEALENGHSYQNLETLCKKVGHRLSGSEGAEKAVNWGYELLKSYEFDTVYLQPVMVPKWVRGKEEKLSATVSGKKIDIKAKALGGSVGTNDVLKAPLLIVNGLAALETLTDEEVRGKIVLFNEPMNARFLSTFHAYGACVGQRGQGAAKAAEKGAVAVLVRSMTLKYDDEPHTGSLWYKEGVKQIPAAAISTKASTELANWARESEGAIEIALEMHCKTEKEVQSYNVIAEMRGSKSPNKIIVFGGHLDSWDVGEGAHDDGAGIIHAIETLRLFKKLGIRSQHTLRCVLFMNEENGNKGGIKYAENVLKSREEHILAIESDRGGFTPHGFSVDATDEQLKKLRIFEPILNEYDLFYFRKGYGGVDISPLKNGKVILVGLVPDSQRYFDFHHAETDVFENVHKRELELGSAAVAGFVYLFDLIEANQLPTTALPLKE